MNAIERHWADQYRDAPRGSLENKVYLAACYSQGSEDHIREIGRVAFNEHTNIWHAAWVVNGGKGECNCAPCSRNRRNR
jgi:hypothetical protein